MTAVAPTAPRMPPSGGLRTLMTTGTVHFVGVGGAGMCALAEAMARQGGRITGCDLAPGEGTRSLERLGVRVQMGHDPGHLDGVVAVVASAAVPHDHPELRAARDSGIPVLKRAEALGEWVGEGTVVAVAGTHGKTTTTAMLTQILAQAGKDPTGFVGGRVPAWEGNLRPGSDTLFVVEADEYDRSFHRLRPAVAVVTNLDADHLDIYGDLDGVRAGFRTFLEGVDPAGTVLVCADDPGASSLLAGLGREGRTYGLAAGSQLRATGVELEGSPARFRVWEDGRSRGELELPVPGLHNVLNALGAAAAARALGAEWSAIREALAGFAGVGRRFESLGSAAGVRVVDDYAHHPTEISVTLAAARSSRPTDRLVAVFQPHLYSRTRDFAGEFGRALSAADSVWVTEVYPAREAPIPGVDGELVASEVRAAVGRGEGVASEVVVHRELDGLAEALADALRPGDLCLTLGAGTIERVGPELMRRLHAREGRGCDA